MMATILSFSEAIKCNGVHPCYGDTQFVTSRAFKNSYFKKGYLPLKTASQSSLLIFSIESMKSIFIAKHPKWNLER